MYKYGNRHFWCRGYYVDTVGKKYLIKFVTFLNFETFYYKRN